MPLPSSNDALHARPIQSGAYIYRINHTIDVNRASITFGRTFRSPNHTSRNPSLHARIPLF